MIDFKILDPRYSPEALGFIPTFLSEENDASARDQLHVAYAHGGGWLPFEGFKVGPTGEIMYPGEPALHPIAVAALRDEIIRIFPHAWVSITQPDGTTEISRMD